MCYVGKATKIFVFIVTVLVVIGIVLGFRLVRHTHPNNSISPSPPAFSFPDPPPHSIPSASNPPSQFTQPPPSPTITNPIPPPPPDTHINPLPPPPSLPPPPPLTTTVPPPTVSPPGNAMLVTPGSVHA